MRYVDAESGLILDPEKSVRKWSEQTRWDGRNMVSLSTGSQWDHERLHLTSQGNYWLETYSQREGVAPSGRLVAPKEATAWLLKNGYDMEDIPEQLLAYIDEVTA